MIEDRYTVTLTESQLRMIANCVEDCSRFMGGQCELHNMTSCLDHYRDLRESLERIKPLVTPELGAYASYGWNGGGCPNEAQRLFIAKSYAIYREILHVLTVEAGIDNVYSSPTLRCEDGGELIKIVRIKNADSTDKAH